MAAPGVPESRHRRRSLRAAGAVLPRLAAAHVLSTPATTSAVAWATGADASEGGVTIEGYRYGGGELHIEAGESVTWTNADDAPHTVTATSGPSALASPELAKGESWTYTFAQPGSVRYTCTLHPDMAASVIVAPATVAAASTVPAPTEALVAGLGVGAQPALPSSGPEGDPSAGAAVQPTLGEAASAPVVTTEVTRSTRVSPLLVLAAVTAAVTVFGALCFTTRRPVGSGVVAEKAPISLAPNHGTSPDETNA